MADPRSNRNRNTVLACLLSAAGMAVLTLASVPLYDYFCQATGYGGTTKTATHGSDTISKRTVKIRFDATMNSGLHWRFEPVQREMVLHLGETGVGYYRVTNLESVPVTGMATFNVTPQKAGVYVSKIDGASFKEQYLKPGQSVKLPVTFFVDPKLETDPNVTDVKTITLSYTFFRKDGGKPDNRTAQAGQAAKKQAGIN